MSTSPASSWTRPGSTTCAPGSTILLANEGQEEGRRDPAYLQRFASSRDALTCRVGELRAAQEARAIVEERYLAGQAALFPAAVTAWAEQLKRTEAVANMAVRLGEVDGVPPAATVDAAAPASRTVDSVTGLVEPAKATALEKLGEGERASGIAERWLRTKLAAGRT